jgi:hypothetical protein
VYGSPNKQILEKSSNALWCCEYYGNEALQAFPVTWIKSCIAMPPLNKPADQWFFVCEKMGLAVASMGGNADDFNENAGNGDLDYESDDDDIYL